MIPEYKLFTDQNTQVLFESLLRPWRRNNEIAISEILTTIIFQVTLTHVLAVKWDSAGNISYKIWDFLSKWLHSSGGNFKPIAIHMLSPFDVYPRSPWIFKSFSKQCLISMGFYFIIKIFIPCDNIRHCSVTHWF